MPNEELAKMLRGIIPAELKPIKDELVSVKTQLGELEPIKIQLDENTRIAKALLHRTEELDAKFDGLLLATATKESIARLEAKMASKEDIDRLAHDVNFLVRKAAEHDEDIRRLRKAE